ncbi:2-oxoglutarate and iron-dependent oxygenase domain-containing protein ICU11 (Protein INCURVATA 11) [Durusdinium trenchii]
MVELLQSLRHFLLDPKDYLGYEGSESPEARRLQNWCRDVARVNGQRLQVIKKYGELCRHHELFDPITTLKEDWFHPKIWALMKGEEELKDVLTEHLPGEVYSFPLFKEDFCDLLLDEIFNFYSSGLPARRPNSMNNYGIILSDIGLEPFVEKLQEFLQKLGEELFPGPGSCWDGHHCFIVRYREGEDLGLDMHTDDSDVTFNVCLGLDFAGAGLQFCGAAGAANHRKYSMTYSHKKGHCVVHLGRKRHGADDITSGERLNLILWNHSSEYRQSKDYRMPAYAREEAAPDPVCLSYTHDRDFGVFKDYPKNKQLFRGRGWCPPVNAEYAGFRPEGSKPSL